MSGWAEFLLTCCEALSRSSKPLGSLALHLRSGAGSLGRPSEAALATSADKDNNQATPFDQNSRATYKCYEQQITNPSNQSYSQGSHGQNYNNTEDNEGS